MRTIKFRGKRLDNNEWVYGFLYQLELLPYGGLGTMILTDGDNCESDAIFPFNLAFRNGVDLFMVDPATVGQFTGLQDADGNDIYEGDIVRSTNSNEFVYEVVYEGKRFASFGLRRNQDVFIHYFGEAIEPDECEVIGNVFDNPGLIEKGGEQ